MPQNRQIGCGEQPAREKRRALTKPKNYSGGDGAHCDQASAQQENPKLNFIRADHFCSLDP